MSKKLQINTDVNGTDIGCHIGSAHISEFSYAYDITLLCPSIRMLNEIIVLCCEYAKKI